MSDEYTATPTHVRCFEENGEWFVDGVDTRTDKFTDACWTYDTQDEALNNVADFLSYADHYLFTWEWPTDREFHVDQRVYLTEEQVSGKVVAIFDDGRFYVQTDDGCGAYSPEFLTAE